MTHSLPPDAIAQLKQCLTLAQSVETQAEAKEMFEPLYEQIRQENPQLADFVQLMWQEVIAARRSAGFWQQISEYEKSMADQMLKSLADCRQNYLRLVQEM